MLAFERLMAKASRSDVHDGTRFFKAGPGRAHAVLESLVLEAQVRGELIPAEPRQAVNDLIGLWHGFWRVEMQYGNREQPDAAECSRLARHAVRQFLRLYAVS